MALKAGAAVKDDSVAQLKSTKSRFRKPEHVQQSTPDGIDTPQALPKQILTRHTTSLRARVDARKHKYAVPIAAIQSKTKNFPCAEFRHTLLVIKRYASEKTH